MNLGFFSGNEIFWKTRWESSIDPSATADRTLVCYKETHANDKIDPTSAWTGTWEDPRFSPPADGGRPQNALIGQIFYVNDGATTAIQVPASDAKMRIWRNTSIANMSSGTATLADSTLGYEWDSDLDNGFRPGGVIDMSLTTVSNAPVLVDYGSTFGSATASHSLTLYKASSGALVFAAGTCQWSWGLDSDHDRGSGAADVRMQQATVNLLADMGIQPATLMSGLVAATKSADTTGPTVTITAPTPNGTYQLGQSVTVSGTASDSGGGIVAGVEYSIDGGQTWHPATGRTSWNFSFATQFGGSLDLLVRAVDDSANIGSAATLPMTVTGPTGQTIFGQHVPASPADTDGSAVELGVKFKADVNGTINGIRFYKGTGNTGTHVADLWTSGGALLATATFANESATGWQTVAFSTPISITAGTVYVASYYAPKGHYAEDGYYFSNSSTTSGHLQAVQAGISGANGVYRSGSGFPNQNYDSSNYFVDVLFSPAGTDTTPPSVASETPSPNATNVSTGTSVTATFSEDVNSATITFTLKDASNVTVAGTGSYDSGTRTYTFAPAASLAAGVQFTASISASDTSGNAMTSPFAWSFTTAAVDTTPPYVTATTPGDGATDVPVSTAPTATFSEDVNPATIVFTLSGGATGTVSYNATTHTATLTPTSSLAYSTSYTASISASDTAGNAMSAPTMWTFATAAQPAPASNIFPAGTTPTNPSVNDASAVELGVKFDSNVAGSVTGIRFYKGSGNTGTHIGNLWTIDGTLLASATFSGETSTGWQSVTFATPVNIAAGTVYVASYFAPKGHYAEDDNYFASSGADNGNLHALKDGVNGGDGVYLYTSSSDFPTDTYHSANYYVDVVFQAADATPPTVSSTSPADGAGNVPVAVTPSAVFSESVQSGTIVMTVVDALDNPVPGTVAYDDPSHTATFTPTSALAGQTTYTVTVSGAHDLSGNTMSPVSWSFTTADVTPPTVISTSPVDGTADVPVGVAPSVVFSESVQSGTIVMTVVDALDNPVPGTVSYDDPSHTATFTPTSALDGQTTYTVTVSGAHDLSGNTMSPVSWSFTTADVTPPTVTLTSPVDGTTDVPVGVAPSATFSESVQSGTIVMTVVDALDNPVPGTVTYDDPSHSATFTPDAPWRI